jgi:hypothetical protein
MEEKGSAGDMKAVRILYPELQRQYLLLKEIIEKL